LKQNQELEGTAKFNDLNQSLIDKS